MLGDDIARALPGLCEHANSMMVSAVIVRRQTGTTRNATNGQITPTWSTIYDGPAELKFPEAQSRGVDVAGQRFSEQSPIVKFPVAGEHAAAAATIRVDDVGEVTLNPPNPLIVGTEFRIDGDHAPTNATARRLPVEVLSHA